MKLTIKCACGKEATFLSSEETITPPEPRKLKAERQGSLGWQCPDCPKTIYTTDGAVAHLYNVHGKVVSAEDYTQFKERRLVTKYRKAR